MADPIDGTEIKLRYPELPPIANRWTSQTGLAVDDLANGPGFALPKELTEFGIATLPPGQGNPTNLPAGTVATVPVAIGSKVENYPLSSLFSAETFYLGPKQFPPTVDNQGLPLRVGHLYYNTLDLAFYVWSPSNTWTLASAAFPGALRAYYYLPAISTTVIPLGGPLQPDSKGNILAFALTGDEQDRDPINLYLNGALLTNNVDYILTEGGVAGDYITLVHAAQGGSVIVVQVLGKPEIDYASNATSVNTTGWIFNGTNATFPMRNNAGDDIIPVSTINMIVGFNGRILDPTRDYTVTGPNITFIEIPTPGAEIFVTVGLPIGDAVGLSQPTAISPYSYGAVGNGVTDDTAALTETINQVNARKAVLDLSRGNFRVTAPLPVITNPVIDGHGSGSLYLDFDIAGGALLDCYVAETAIFNVSSIAVTTFDFAGTFSNDTEVTAVTCNVPAGQIPPAVGDIVKVTAGVQVLGSDVGDFIGQHLYVAAVVNTTGTTWVVYSPSLLVDTYGTTGVQLHVLNRRQPCMLRDFAVRANYTRLVAEDWKGIAVRITGAVSPYTSGLTFEDLHQGLFLCGTWRASTNSTFCRRLRNATASEVPPVVGYGVVDAGSYMSVHSDLSGDDCRHVYTTAALQNTNPRLMWGRSFRPTVNSGAAGNCSSSAYDTHSDCYEAHFSNLEVDGSYYGEQGTGSGFQFRGIRCKATNCHVRNGPQGFVFYKQNAGEVTEHVLEGCSYEGNGKAIRIDRGDDLSTIDRQQISRVKDFECITTARDAVSILDCVLEIEGLFKVTHIGSTPGARVFFIDGNGVINSVGGGQVVHDFSQMTGTPNPRVIGYEDANCGCDLEIEVIAGAIEWLAWVVDNVDPPSPAGSFTIGTKFDVAPEFSGFAEHNLPSHALPIGSLALYNNDLSTFTSGGSSAIVHPANPAIGQVERSLGDYFGIGPYSLYQFGAEPQVRLAATPTSYHTQIQNAIARAAAAKRPLIIPPGTWFHEGLVLPSEACLIGQGRYLSGFRIMVNVAQHNFRGADDHTMNVELGNFFIDGSRFYSGTGIKPADLSGHMIGDGIYYNGSTSTSGYTAQTGVNVPHTDPLWRIHDLEIFQTCRHGIYLNGRGEHKVFDIFIGDVFCDGIHNRSSDSLFQGIECGGIGRNGLVANGGDSRYTNCKFYFCGSNSARPDADSTAIRNQWWTTTGGSGECQGGGCVGVQVRDGGISQVFVNCEVQDTWASGWVITTGKDIVMRGCQANNIKSLRQQQGVGSVNLVNSAILVMENTANGCDIELSHFDQFATLNYTTDSVLRWSNNTGRDNRVEVRYDSQRQSFPTPGNFTDETQVAAQGRGNTFTFTPCIKG